MFRLQRYISLVLRRPLHTCRVLTKERRVDTETVYAQKVLSSSVPQALAPYEPIAQPSLPSSQDFAPLSNAELLGIFEGVANYCRINDIQISDPKFNSLVDEIAKRTMDLDFDGLHRILSILSVFPYSESKYSQNFFDIWKSVEDAAIVKMPTWSNALKIKLVHAFYQIDVSKSTFFSYKTLLRLGNNPENLPKDQLISLFFILNHARKPTEDMCLIEKAVSKLLPELTVEEISLMAMAFFKTETRIKNFPLLHKISKILEWNAETVDDITLANILKILRYSSRIGEEAYIRELLNALAPQIHRLRLVTCIHVVLLGSSLQMCHEPSLKIVLDRFINEIKTARLKDIERVLFILGLYDFETPDLKKKLLCDLVIEEIPLRIKEFSLFPRCLPQILNYLISNNVEPPLDLLSTALNRDFLKMVYGINYFKYDRDIISLDCYAELLGDSYSGNRLLKKTRDFWCSKNVDYIPSRNSRYNLTKADKLLLEIHEACEEVVGMSSMCQILPHFQRADIVVAFDTRKKQTVSVQHRIEECRGSTIYSRDHFVKDLENRDDLKLVAVVVGGWNLFLRNTNRPTGVLKYKLRQLEQVGFDDIVVVHWDRWPGSQMSQVAFMKEELDRVLLPKR